MITSEETTRFSSNKKNIENQRQELLENKGASAHNYYFPMDPIRQLAYLCKRRISKNILFGEF